MWIKLPDSERRINIDTAKLVEKVLESTNPEPVRGALARDLWKDYSIASNFEEFWSSWTDDQTPQEHDAIVELNYRDAMDRWDPYPVTKWKVFYTDGCMYVILEDPFKQESI